MFLAFKFTITSYTVQHLLISHSQVSAESEIFANHIIKVEIDYKIVFNTFYLCFTQKMSRLFNDVLSAQL